MMKTESIWPLSEHGGTWPAGFSPHVVDGRFRSSFAPFDVRFPFRAYSVGTGAGFLATRFFPGYPYIYSPEAYGITANARDSGHFSPWLHYFAGVSYPQAGSGGEQIPVETVYQNPLQPSAGTGGQGEPHFLAQPFPYPRPHPNYMMHFMKPPSGFQTILNSFKSEEGTLDIKKMIDTAGQMAYAVNQFQSLLKGLGGIFKMKGTPV